MRAERWVQTSSCKASCLLHDEGWKMLGASGAQPVPGEEGRSPLCCPGPPPPHPQPPGGKRPGRYRCHRGEEHAAIYGAGKEEGTSRCKGKQGWRKRPDEGVLAGPGPSLVSDGETRGVLSARTRQRALAPSLINNIPLIWRFHQHLPADRFTPAHACTSLMPFNYCR